MNRGWYVWSLYACLCVTGAMPSFAAESPINTAKVRDALRHGWDGDLAEQQSLLNTLLKSQPDLVLARGHAGFVRHEDAWVQYEDFGKLASERQKSEQYAELRREMADTLEGHLELANWCEKQGLVGQEHAHLRRVLEFDADHAAARARLGFEKQGADWVSRSERQAADARAESRDAAIRKYRPQIRAIVTGLSNRLGGSAADAQERKKLFGRLTAITDPAAVPALESELDAYLGRLDQQPGSTEHKIADVLVPLVRAIGKFRHPEAAESLARIATSIGLSVPMEVSEAYVMESMGPRFPTAAELAQVTPLGERLSRELRAVYREAIAQLKNQPRDAFAPYLLSGLSSPIQGQFAVYRERDGDVMVRLFYARETEERRENLESRTRLNPTGADTTGKARSQALSGQLAVGKVLAADQILRQQNLAVLHRNLRVTDVLRDVTGQPCSTTPDHWWNWWNEENEVFLAFAKPVVAKVQKESYTVIAPPPPPPLYSVVDSVRNERRSEKHDDRKKDCLAAGTMIWTSRGMSPVEKLLVGDLVLSQHPETGELAFKPVLKTTVRPSGPLVEIRVAGETIRTSGGHPFWVVDQGWIRARQLAPGNKLHGIGGPVTIESVVNSSEQEQTYNLIVDEFHSYFVGSSRAFSHDNTVRQPTGMAVPGIPRSLQ